MNVLLIGLRGSGKSSVAQLVAQSTLLTAIDIDVLTAQYLKTPTVSKALKIHGQPAFRAAEAEVLSDLLMRDGQIIASGGGTPTAPGAAELIAASSIASDLRVFYLRASSQTLQNRLKSTDLFSRPSLTGLGVLEEIQTLLNQRDALYTKLADEIITVDQLTIEQTAAHIVALLTG